jgi:hypothetical protein
MDDFERAIESVWTALAHLEDVAAVDQDADRDVWRPALSTIRDELRDIEQSDWPALV